MLPDKQSRIAWKMGQLWMPRKTAMRQLGLRVRWGLAVLSLIVSSLALAVERRAVASGQWSNPAIWSPAGVPEQGDRVLGLGSNDVRIESDEEIGDGSETIALTVDGTGRLIIGEGASLIVRGHLAQSARFAEVVIEADARLLFAPQINQILEFQQNNSAQRLTFSGSANARGRVGLTEDAMGHYFFSSPGFRDSGFSGSFGIVEDAFDPVSENGWGVFLNNEPDVSGITADHIEFLRCGQIRVLGLGAGEHTLIDLNALTFREQAKSGSNFIVPAFAFDGYLDLNFEAPPTAVTKRITNLVSESAISLRFVEGFTLDDFVLTIDGSGHARSGNIGGNAATHNFVFVYSQTGGRSTNLIADLTDTSYFYMAADNPHGWSTPELRGDATVQNFWFESNFTNQSDTGDALLSDGPQRQAAATAAATDGTPVTVTLKHSGSIGDTSDDPTHPVLFTFNNSEGLRLLAEHNVARVDPGNQAISIDENGTTPSGTGIALRNNIFFSDDDSEPSFAIGSVVAQPVSEDNSFTLVDFNLYYNLSEDGADGNLGVHRAPFTNVIDSNSLVASPDFVDESRNIASWDASLGGPGTAQHAITMLGKRNDDTGFDPAYDVRGLTAYVAGGFTTTNPLAVTSDGSVIGPALFLPDVAPTIDQQPISMSVSPGTDIVFSVSASGRPDPNFQWRKDGFELVGETSATFALSDVSSQDEGNYDVVVGNSVASIESEIATLTINTVPVLPTITTQPVSQTVVDGGSAVFSVVAQSSVPLSYQWQLDGVDLDGATSATLELGAVTEGDAGSYRVIVGNTAGEIASFVATLIIEPATGGSGEIEPEDLVVAFVARDSSLTRPSDRVVRDTLLALGHEVMVFDDDEVSLEATTAANLVIISSTVVASAVDITFADDPRPVLVWEPGIFSRMGLSSLGGTTQAQTDLNLVDNSDTIGEGFDLGPVAVTRSQQNFSFGVVGGDGEVVATIANDPSRAAIIRYDNGATLANGDIAQGRRLLWYQNNNTANAWTTEGQLLFEQAVAWLVGAAPVDPPAAVAPVITVQPQNLTVEEGSAAEFSVGAEAVPAPSFQWRRDGLDLVGETGALLQLNSVGDSDTGTYQVVVSNSAGSVESALVTLAVQPATAEPPDDDSDEGEEEGENPTDTAPPALESLTLLSESSLLLVFSEPLEEQSAQNPQSYQLDNGALVTTAVLENLATVVLTTSELLGDTTYTLAINNIADLAGNVNNDDSVGTFTTMGNEPDDEIVIAFVARDLSLSRPSDRVVRDTLVGLGHSVLVVDDNGVTLNETLDADLIVISSTVVANEVDDTFTNDARPILVWEPGLFSRMGLGSAGGTVSDQTELSLVDNTSLIGAHLSVGDVLVTGSRQSFSFGLPGGEAQVVATLVGDSGRAAIWRYAEGAQLSSGDPAAGRRVGWYQNNNTASRWTDDGQLLFEQAIEWLLAGDGQVEPPPNSLPVILSQPQNQTVSEGATVEFAVVAQATPAPRYQWQRDGVDIPGEVSSLLRLGSLVEEDSGDYRVRVSNSVGAVISSVASLLVERVPEDDPVDGEEDSDASAPEFDAVEFLSPTSLLLTFSEPLEDSSVGDLGNFQLDNGGVVIGALLQSPTTVLVTTMELLSSTTYALELFGLTDLAGNLIESGSTRGFTTPADQVDLGFVIAFVARDQILSRPSDRVVRDTLVGLGHQVVVFNDNDLRFDDTLDADLVIISSTVVAGEIDTIFVDDARPVLVWEPGLFNRMGLSSVGGLVSGQEELILVDNSVVGSNLDLGPVSVTRSSQPFSFGQAGGDGEVLAMISGDPDRAAIIHYDNGVMLANGDIAQGRRLMWYQNNNTASAWTAEGRRLFEQAVGWLLLGTEQGGSLLPNP